MNTHLMTDTGAGANPAPLPTAFQRPPETDGRVHLTPAPGYVLSTCRNTAEGRGRAVAWGMHVCRAGEGYVLDEHLCEIDPQTDILLLNGDCVTCCTLERHEGKLAFKREEAVRALRNAAGGFDDEVRAIAARHGETAAILPGEAGVRAVAGSLGEE